MGLLENLWDYATPQYLVIGGGAATVLWIVTSSIDRQVRLNRLPGHSKGRSYQGTFPFGVRFVYNLITATKGHNALAFWRNMFIDCGCYTGEVRVLGERIVSTADPENIKAILATQFADFGKGETFRRDWQEFLGDSIFTTDGDLWHTSRQLIRPQFIRDRVSDLHCFESHVQTLFKAIANGGALTSEHQYVDMAAADGKPVEMRDLLFRFSLDVSTEFLLGEDVKSLSTPKQGFAEAFNEVQRVQSIFARAGNLKPFVPKRTFDDGLKVVNDFVNHYIEMALRLSPEELETKTKSDKEYTFLHELASFTRDRKVLRDQVVAVLLAGRDTTASILSWTFLELARHPDVVRKLRAEILDHVGHDRAPTYSDLKNMKYLQYVVNETLRLYPAVPFNVRVALKDTTLPRGGGPDGDEPLAVLKGTPVGYSTLVMQRRADLYPDASDKFAPVEEFSPDRWFNWIPRPWQYVPFNGGPRICIGQQFALTEMSYVLCRVFQKYERIDNLTGCAAGEEPVLQTDITLSPANEVKVAFWEGKKKE